MKFSRLVCLSACFWIALVLVACEHVSGGGGEAPRATVTFVDVGQGLAVLLEYNGHYAMYDVGPDSIGIADTLKNRGIDSLDWVLLSHSHRDHVGGFWNLQAGDSNGASKRIKVGRLVVGPDTAGGWVRDSTQKLARMAKMAVDTITRGDYLWLGDSSGKDGGKLRLDCLWPPAYAKLGENTASVVVRVSLEGGEGENALGNEESVLLVGDLDSLAEMRLIEISGGMQMAPSEFDVLRAGLLQVGHHGSVHSSTLKFLTAVEPRYAVISVGANNSYGHPNDEVLHKLEYVAKKILRTDLDGSVEFYIEPNVGVVR